MKINDIYEVKSGRHIIKKVNSFTLYEGYFEFLKIVEFNKEGFSVQVILSTHLHDWTSKRVNRGIGWIKENYDIYISPSNRLDSIK